MHPKNKHQGSYDMQALMKAHPDLEQYVAENKYGTLSIDFHDNQAVRCLNHALLKLFYKINYWHIDDTALTPAIPSRADYIHNVAELVGTKTTKVKCLDIGVGANCIYPILGIAEYNWSFVGSDIAASSLKNAQLIIDKNHLDVELREQGGSNIFHGIIRPDDYFTLTICNPPFHDSAQSARAASQRKLRNLGSSSKAKLNFAGNANELWCKGGEKEFITKMIRESAEYKNQVLWFTTLVSKEDNLRHLKRELKALGTREIKVLEMSQGNKKSRVLAWGY